MTHYKTLGVEDSATEKEITSAYRKLARTTHPDQGGDAAEFDRVAQAYAVLRDAERRAEYDASLVAAANPAPPTGSLFDDPDIPWGVQEEVPIPTASTAPRPVSLVSPVRFPWAWHAATYVTLAAMVALVWSVGATRTPPIGVAFLVAAALVVGAALSRHRWKWVVLSASAFAASVVAPLGADISLPWQSHVTLVLVAVLAWLIPRMKVETTQFRNDKKYPRQWAEFVEYAERNGGKLFVRRYTGLVAEGARVEVHDPAVGRDYAIILSRFGVPYQNGDWIVRNTVNDVIAACPDAARESWRRVHGTTER